MGRMTQNIPQKKKILLLATGGTIASRKSDHGLKPQIRPEELLRYLPQVEAICEVNAVQILNLDSSNMEPKHWKKMVQAIADHYEDYDGFDCTRYGYHGIHGSSAFLYGAEFEETDCHHGGAETD